MSTQKVLVNDTVRIRVRFVDIDPSTLEEVDIEPANVLVNITNSAGEEVVSEDAEPQTPSSFYYDFIPTEPGEYNVKFTGILVSGNTVVVQQKLYVSSVSDNYQPVTTLRSEEIIIFAADVDPLYIDPEELTSYFPDATLLEIGEIVHSYSQEVKSLLSLRDDQTTEDLPFIALEYIKSATACDLSRTYEFNTDDEVSVTLGDFTVVNRSAPRTTVSRDNATTWCQLAAVYRKELLSKKTGFRTVQPKGTPGKPIATSGGVRHPETGKIVYLSDRELYGPGRKFITKEDSLPDRDLRSYD